MGEAEGFGGKNPPQKKEVVAKAEEGDKPARQFRNNNSRREGGDNRMRKFDGERQPRKYQDGENRPPRRFDGERPPRRYLIRCFVLNFKFCFSEVPRRVK